MVCLLDKCCFCIDLKTGSLIIGYLKLISIIMFIAVLLLFGGWYYEGLGYLFTVAVVLSMEILSFAFIALLIIGLRTNLPGLVLGFLIFSLFNLVYVSFVVYLVFLGWYMPLIITGYIVTQFYCLAVIGSHYYKMGVEDTTTLTSPSNG